jgi:hypothetical protein
MQPATIQRIPRDSYVTSADARAARGARWRVTVFDAAGMSVETVFEISSKRKAKKWARICGATGTVAKLGGIAPAAVLL